jgi:hypothetical protein
MDALWGSNQAQEDYFPFINPFREDNLQASPDDIIPL